MKVKLLRAICCPDGSFQPGNEPDLEESTAKSLINSGYAEALEPLEPESNNTTDDGADEPDGSKAVPKGRRNSR